MKNNLNLIKINRNALIIATLALPSSLTTENASAMIRNFIKTASVRTRTSGQTSPSSLTPTNTSVRLPRISSASNLSVQGFAPGDNFQPISGLIYNPNLDIKQQLLVKNRSDGSKDIYSKNFKSQNGTGGETHYALEEVVQYGRIRNGIFQQNPLGRSELTPEGRQIIIKHSEETNPQTPQQVLKTNARFDKNGKASGEDVSLQYYKTSYNEDGDPYNKLSSEVKIGFISKEKKFFGNDNLILTTPDNLETLKSLAEITPPPPSSQTLKSKIANEKQSKILKYSDSKHELVSKGEFDKEGNGVQSSIELMRYKRDHDSSGEPYNKYIGSVKIGDVDKNGNFSPNAEGMKFLNDNDVEILQKFVKTDLSGYKEGTPFVSKNKKLSPSDRQPITPKNPSKDFNQTVTQRYHPAIHGDNTEVFFSDPFIPGKRKAKSLGKMVLGAFVKNDEGELRLGYKEESLEKFNYKIVPGNGTYAIVLQGRKPTASSPDVTTIPKKGPAQDPKGGPGGSGATGGVGGSGTTGSSPSSQYPSSSSSSSTTSPSPSKDLGAKPKTTMTKPTGETDPKGSILLLEALKKYVESSKKTDSTPQVPITSGTISSSGVPTGTRPKTKTIPTKVEEQKSPTIKPPVPPKPIIQQPKSLTEVKPTTKPPIPPKPIIQQPKLSTEIKPTTKPSVPPKPKTSEPPKSKIKSLIDKFESLSK